MAGFELDPNMPLGHTGKLELLYNRALQRSKVPVTAQFLLFFLVGCPCGNIEELKQIFGLDFKRETKSLGVLQRLPTGILKASVLCDSHTLKGGHSVGSPIFLGHIPRFNAMNIGDPR